MSKIDRSVAATLLVILVAIAALVAIRMSQGCEASGGQIKHDELGNSYCHYEWKRR